MNSDKTVNKIESLQALRALAFIGIFLCHAGTKLQWAELSVSIFYVMSGVLLEFHHKDDEIDYSFRGRISFSLNRIKKLYLLHIITMIIVVLIYHLMDKVPFSDMYGNILLNVFLVQTWVPNSATNVSLNGVAWYLSVTMFLYFIYPIIHHLVNTTKTKKLYVISFLIIFFQWISCVIMLFFFEHNSVVYVWFMYCFPIFRI